MCGRIVCLTIVALVFCMALVARAEQNSDPAQSNVVPLKPAQSPAGLHDFDRFASFDLSIARPDQSPSLRGHDVRAVHGQVVDHLGQPIVGAQVTITQANGAAPGGLETYDRTDDLGRFLVYGDLFRTRIVVRRAEKDLWSAELKPEQMYLKFVWPDAATMRLEVGKTELVPTEQELPPESNSPTVQFVHSQLDARMQYSSLHRFQRSFQRSKVKALVDNADRPGVAAELLRIVSDPKSPHEWTGVAAESLGQMTETEGVVEGILALIQSPGYVTRRGSLNIVLYHPARKVPEIIEAMNVMTKDSSALTRFGAYVTLGQVAKNRPQFLEQITPVLIRGLSDPDYHSRELAAQYLGGFNATQAKQPLANLLNDKDPSVRLAGAKALWRIDGNSERLVRVATELLAHEGVEFRAIATLALNDLEIIPAVTLDAVRANLGNEGRYVANYEDSQWIALARSSRQLLDKHGAIEKQPAPNR